MASYGKYNEKNLKRFEEEIGKPNTTFNTVLKLYSSFLREILVLQFTYFA